MLLLMERKFHSFTSFSMPILSQRIGVSYTYANTTKAQKSMSRKINKIKI